MEMFQLTKQMIPLYPSKTNAIDSPTLIYTTFQHLHTASSFCFTQWLIQNLQYHEYLIFRLETQWFVFSLHRNSTFSSISNVCASVCSKTQVPFKQTYSPGLVEGLLTLMSASLFRSKLPEKRSFQCKSQSFFSFPYKLCLILLGCTDKVGFVEIPR